MRGDARATVVDGGVELRGDVPTCGSARARPRPVRSSTGPRSGPKRYPWSYPEQDSKALTRCHACLQGRDALTNNQGLVRIAEQVRQTNLGIRSVRIEIGRPLPLEL